MTMQAPNSFLTPSVLRALAVGIDRLGDGDPNDIQDADEAAKAMARAGYIAVNGWAHRASEASSGYVNGHYAWIDGQGKWAGTEVSAGDTLYVDSAGTVALRCIEEV